MKLRDYQRDTIARIYQALDRGFSPVAEVPTGGGKSLINATICQDIVEKRGGRVLCATHVKELIRQNRDELKELWPAAEAGIYSAGLRRRETNHPIIFGGVQSIFPSKENSKVPELGAFSALVIDEAHLVSPNDGTRYRGMIEQLRTINPDMAIVGLTATPMRLDQGYLHHGKGAIFDCLVKSPLASMRRLIDLGHLSYIHAKAGEEIADLSGVRKRGGEFVEGDLAGVFGNAVMFEAALRDTKAVMDKGRKCILGFCAGVENARLLSEMFNEAGIPTGYVIGDTPSAERERTIEDFRLGRLKVLWSVGVLTTGFNVKQVDCILLLRAMCSVSLYIQIIGRGTRVCDGKTDCLIVDYGSNVARLGPVDDPVVDSKGRCSGEGEAPTKICPGCKEYLHAAKRECPECGHVFPPPDQELSDTAANAEVLSSAKVPEPAECLKVDEVVYAIHVKAEDKPRTLRVEYHCGIRCVKEWVCFEHDGFARTKAERWWKARTNGSDAPTDMDKVLGYIDNVGILEPEKVEVRREGRFDRVVGYELGRNTSKTDSPKEPDHHGIWLDETLPF